MRAAYWSHRARCSLCSSSAASVHARLRVSRAEGAKYVGGVRGGAEGGKIGKMLPTPRANCSARKGHPCPAEPPPQRAPHRRGGDARASGARPGAAPLGGAKAVELGCPTLPARRCWIRGRYITYFSLKSETIVGWQITRGFQIWSQKFRARSVAPSKVCRAPQFIRRFNSMYVCKHLSRWSWWDRRVLLLLYTAVIS